MKLKLMRTVTAMILLLGFAVHLNAQTSSEAVEALKEGVSKSQAKDYLGAVESFKNAFLFTMNWANLTMKPDNCC